MLPRFVRAKVVLSLELIITHYWGKILVYSIRSVILEVSQSNWSEQVLTPTVCMWWVLLALIFFSFVALDSATLLTYMLVSTLLHTSSSVDTLCLLVYYPLNSSCTDFFWTLSFIASTQRVWQNLYGSPFLYHDLKTLLRQ